LSAEKRNIRNIGLGGGAQVERRSYTETTARIRGAGVVKSLEKRKRYPRKKSQIKGGSH